MNKFKDFWSAHQEKFVLSIGGILIAAAGFGAGRLSVLEKSEPVVIEDPVELVSQCPECPECSAEEKTTITIDDKDDKTEQGNYVASKNGSKYYLTNCSGANRIKEENKVWFETAEEAKDEGYGPAKNCKGL